MSRIAFRHRQLPAIGGEHYAVHRTLVPERRCEAARLRCELGEMGEALYGGSASERSKQQLRRKRWFRARLSVKCFGQCSVARGRQLGFSDLFVECGDRKGHEDSNNPWRISPQYLQDLFSEVCPVPPHPGAVKISS